MTRLALIAAASLIVLTGCTCATDPSEPAVTERPPIPEGDPPNVLVVIWDTTRADHLSLYGYERPTTPRVDAWAQTGVVYERAVSPAMWTLPSHASLFTGLAETTHGANSHHKWLDSRHVTLAEWFGDQGYDTYLFSANPYLQDHTNLGQGFQVREFPWSKRWKQKSRRATMGKVLADDASNSLGPKWQKGRINEGRGNDKVKDAGPVAAEALLAWVDERPQAERPWLAVLNYMEAHAPRIPSLASRRAIFGKEEIQRQLAFDQGYGWLLAYMVDRHEFSPEEIQLIVDVYDASIRDLDTATADLLDELDRRGVLDDTIVVLTADHGEHLGEHHLMGHKFSVYNPLIRVPLMIRYPKALDPGRVTQVVSNLSVFSTLTELAELPAPEGTQAPSLLRLEQQPDAVFAELTHATPQALGRAETAFPDLDWRPFLRPLASVETADFKCIEASDGTRELYRMPDDLLETEDLAAVDPERTARVCDRIAAWRASIPKFDPSQASDADKPRKGFDKETRRQLCELGYADECEDFEPRAGRAAEAP